jgi:hypothetical protein
MPVVSRAQAGLMGMTQTAKGRAKLKALGFKHPPSATVGHEFLHASKGMKFSKLPAHHHGIHAATAGKSL